MPCKTIYYASTKLVAGDTLYVRGGTYDEGTNTPNATVWRAPNGGTFNNPITLKAYPGETVIYDGGTHGVSGDCTYYIWLGFGSTNSAPNSNHKYIVVDGFILQNFKGEAISMNRSANNITIQNTTIKNTRIACHSGHGIYIQGYANPWPINITIRNNYFSTPLGASLHMWHGIPNGSGRSGENIFFYNNIIEGLQTGFVAGDGAKDIYLYNNTFYGGIGEAINLRHRGQDSGSPHMSNIVIKNNIIYSTNGNGFSDSLANSDIYTEDNNLWYDNTGKPFCLNSVSGTCGGRYSLSEYRNIRGQGQYSIQTDPLFINATTKNFRLSSGSPAVDKGTTLSIVPNDYDGNKRPLGLKYDIGAYEYASGGNSDTTPPAAPSGVRVE